MGDNSIASSLIKPKYDYDQLSFIGKGIDKVVYNLSIKEGDGVMKMTLKKVIGFILFVAFAASLIGIPLIFKAQERQIKQQAFAHEMRNFNLNEKLLKKAQPDIENEAAKKAINKTITSFIPNQVVLSDKRRTEFLVGKNQADYKKGNDWDDVKILSELAILDPKFTKTQGNNFAFVENLPTVAVNIAASQGYIVTQTRENENKQKYTVRLKANEVVQINKSLIDEKNKALESLKQATEALNLRAEISPEQLKLLQTQVETLDKRAEISPEDLKKLAAQVETLGKRADISPDDLKQLKAQVETLSKRADISPDDLEVLRKQLVDKKSEEGKVEVNGKQMTGEEIANMLKELTNANQVVKTKLEQQVEQLKNEKEQMVSKGDLENAKQELKKVNDALEQLKQNHKTALTQKVKEAVTPLQEQLKTKDEELEAKDVELQTAQETIEELQEQLKQAQQSKTASNDDVVVTTSTTSTTQPITPSKKQSKKK